MLTASIEETRGRPVHVWIGLLGALVIAGAFALPCTQLGDKPVTPWDLATGSAKALDDLDRARAKVELLPEPPQLPKLLPQNPLREKLDHKRDEMKKKVDLTESILLYIRWGLIALLMTAALQLVPPLWRAGPGFFTAAGWLAGTLGLLFTGTLVVLIFYLQGVKLMDHSIPIETGYWLVLAGTALIALSGLLSVSRASWKWSLPAQLLAGGAWAGFFWHLLMG